MSIKFSDEYFMKIAIKEGYKGLGYTSPNPAVGAVLVNPLTKEIIAKGYHKRYGYPHAEVEAICKAGGKTKGAHLYVTLEPCSHYGKTPPCTEKILEVGISKVICAIRDPNPVARGGLEILKSKGVEVKVGVLEKEAKILTRFFLSYILRKQPWVIMKVASSLDGKIAVSTGDSKWITGEEARKYGHKLRHICDAILVGKNTVIKDNPELTCRLVKGKNPVRIVLDTKLSLSPDYKIFKIDKDKKTVIACGEKASLKKEEVFKNKGIEVWRLPLKRNKIDLKALLEKCYEKGISSLLVEGGAKIHGSVLEENLVDEIFYFVGPVIIGDKKGIMAIEREPLTRLNEALFLKDLHVKKLGNSYLFHAYTQTGLNLLNIPLGEF
ncbi:bifunctional diaminohydroxyphosphoribosylaminopyrimidine deaminase/5-amino-6-(5-phosphoribosylamino)uracil reductase RibD [Thermodesulfobacterium hydrogeniphilum]|uniref:bifunctional diaminohydroxyphosphoribosylaminopyrimidine deaminase/5-amino-6-(5-phosphoribosylamino)uracil reductase RibD n=1 Tax=Thermodesulfobacterium hydrogeniphilum TaxID=161156 RepID=UPI0005715311|nr:bifunctional diaminohydroxyphosphoribosylaminopyrimidine deaminase/5-amino-6-(5-phosphoribosylamino)uracil reductase RibD [Thermodesulfobacterium hydrogeniphilum]